MMWIIAIVALTTFLFSIPYLLRKTKGAGRGVGGSVALALGLAFSSFLEPAKKAAMENIEKKKEGGELAAKNKTATIEH